MNIVWAICCPKDTLSRRWEVHAISISGKYQQQQYHRLVNLLTTTSASDARRIWDRGVTSKTILRDVLTIRFSSGNATPENITVYRHRSPELFYEMIGYNTKKKRFHL